MFFRKLLSNGTIYCSSQASRPPPSYRFGHFNGFGSSFRFLLKLRQLPQSSIRSRVGHYEYRLRNQRTGTFPSPSQAKTAVVIQCAHSSFSAALYPLCFSSLSPPTRVCSSNRAARSATSRATTRRVVTTSSTPEAWN